MISNNLSISSIKVIAFKYQLLTAANNGNDELDEEGNYNYNIEKCMAQLDDLTKKQILDFVKKDVYDEKITLKCLKCDYEETVPWDIVDETWDRDDSPYPISYCQRCDKPHFVPIDIYNQKKKK